MKQIGAMIEYDAIISECGLYRYSLSRIWDTEKGLVNFIGLNPSTADAKDDDSTIKKCVKYAKKWGYGGIIMSNLFAYRTPEPHLMKKAPDAIGHENDEYIKLLADKSAIVIAAWGNDGEYLGRSDLISNLIPNLQCLKINKTGQPAHPLYLNGDLKPLPYKTYIDVRSFIPKPSNFEIPDDVIPKNILISMIDVCDGDKLQMLEKAKTYIKEHDIDIHMSIRQAQKGLLHQYDILDDVKEKNRRVPKSLKEIVKKTIELNKLLDEIPYLDTDSAMPGLGMEMLNYIFDGEEWGREDEYVDKSYRKLEEWNAFKSLLIKHETVFRGIEAKLKTRTKKTRPPTTKLLADFIFEIAKLYEAITDKKFKVGDNIKGSIAETIGMSFIKKSIPLLAKSSIIPYRKYQNVFATKSFKEQTFYNACEYARKELRNTSQKPQR